LIIKLSEQLQDYKGENHSLNVQNNEM